MENNQGNLKTGENPMRKYRVFSPKLSSFILMSLLTLNFGLVPVSAEKGGEFEMDFLKTEVDSEWVNFEPEDADTDSEDKDSAESFDPIAQPSIKDVLTLLQNVQVELAALGNKTDEETQELKNEMADVHDRILDLETGIREVNQTATQILKGQSQMKQKIGANHDEIKKEFTHLSKEMKSQITSSQQAKQEKDVPKSQPTSKPTTSGKDKPKETFVNWNSKTQIHFDASQPTPTPSALSTPQFYNLKNFQGSSFTPSSYEWKKPCVNVLFNFVSSLKTGGHCILICPETRCTSSIFDSSEAACRIIGADTKQVGSLSDIGYYRSVKSFRRC